MNNWTPFILTPLFKWGKAKGERQYAYTRYTGKAVTELQYGDKQVTVLSKYSTYTVFCNMKGLAKRVLSLTTELVCKIHLLARCMEEGKQSERINTKATLKVLRTSDQHVCGRLWWHCCQFPSTLVMPCTEQCNYSADVILDPDNGPKRDGLTIKLFLSNTSVAGVMALYV